MTWMTDAELETQRKRLTENVCLYFALHILVFVIWPKLSSDLEYYFSDVKNCKVYLVWVFFFYESEIILPKS